MARAKKAAVPAPQTTPPALEAIRDAAQRYVLSHECSGLVTSDLEHDATAIRAVDPLALPLHNHPRAFAWVIGRHGTHMMRVLAPMEAELQVTFRSGAIELRTARRDRETLQAFAEVAEADGECYFWDGTALLRCRDAEQMFERYKAATFRSARAEYERRLAFEREHDRDGYIVNDLKERITLINVELEAAS